MKQFSRIRFLGCLIFIAALTDTASAQNLWSSFMVKTEFRKWKFANDIQHRGNIPTHSTNNFFSEPSIGYKLSQSFVLKGIYRHSFAPVTLRSRNRISFSAEWKALPKTSKVKIETRFLYQRRFREDKKVNDLYRLRVDAGYELGNSTPFISFETFNKVYKPYELTRTRSTIGVNIELTELMDVSVFYRRDDNFEDEGVRTTDYIIGVSAAYELKRKSKKEEPAKMF